MINSFLFMVFLVTGLAMIGLILLRRGEGGGLGGALGGGMGDTVFGAKAAKALDKLIAWVSAVFLLSGVVMYTPIGGKDRGLGRFANEPPRFRTLKGDERDKGYLRVKPSNPTEGQEVTLELHHAWDPDARDGDKLTVFFHEDTFANGRFNRRLDKELHKVELTKGEGDEQVAKHRVNPSVGRHTYFAYARDGQGAISIVQRIEITVSPAETNE